MNGLKLKQDRRKDIIILLYERISIRGAFFIYQKILKRGERKMENCKNNKKCNVNNITATINEEEIATKMLQELKDKISPYRIGDEVVCFWGSSGYDQEGIITDNFVYYNDFMKFDVNHSEMACIVRLKNQKLPTGWKVTNNEVIPWRQIKKVKR